MRTYAEKNSPPGNWFGFDLRSVLNGRNVTLYCISSIIKVWRNSCIWTCRCDFAILELRTRFATVSPSWVISVEYSKFCNSSFPLQLEIRTCILYLIGVRLQVKRFGENNIFLAYYFFSYNLLPRRNDVEINASISSTALVDGNVHLWAEITKIIIHSNRYISAITRMPRFRRIIQVQTTLFFIRFDN